MRKTYLLLAGLLITLINFAQNSTNQVNFTFSVNAQANMVTFTNTSILQSDGVRKAFWNFGDGMVAVTAPTAGTTHHYNAPGTYQACLKIYKYNPSNQADSFLLGSECKSIAVQSACTADFYSHDSLNTSVPRLVKFTAVGTNNANAAIQEVCWTFGDGTSSCTQATAANPAPLNVVHSYAANGTYNVCLRIKYANNCVAEKCHSVVVNSATTVPDSCTANFTTHTTSASALGRKFIAQPGHNKNKKPIRICWIFGDGKDTCIQYAANYTGAYWVEHRYAQQGLYEVCATIKYEGGCEKRKCNAVQVSHPIVADTCYFELNAAATTTTSRERKFYVGLMQNRRAEKICWTFGDGTDTCVILSNPVNPQQLLITHIYPAPGNYTVCAKVFYAGGCTVQRCRTVSITLPHTNICGGYFTDSALTANSIRFKATPVLAPNDNVISYGWLFGDGTNGLGQTVTHNYTVTGRYNVCVIIRSTSGCETKICKPVSVAGTNAAQLVLTPNPVTTFLNATFYSTLQQQVSVKIFNANGLMIRSYVRNAVVGANNWTFTDISNLPAGVYSVVVQSPNQLANALFFKQ